VRRRRAVSRKPAKAQQTIKAKRGVASKAARNRDHLPALLSADTEVTRLEHIGDLDRLALAKIANLLDVEEGVFTRALWLVPHLLWLMRLRVDQAVCLAACK